MTRVAFQPVRTLRPLLAGLAVVPTRSDIKISDLVLDSRQMKPGALFLGVPGQNVDGRDFVPHALGAGAAAIVCDHDWRVPKNVEVPCFKVVDLRRNISLIANRFYGFPSRVMCIVGITGTNGKTTCAFLLAQALERLGRRSAFIGTTGIGLMGQFEPNDMTTPDAVSVQRTLSRFVSQGVDCVCLEVSSHGLSQHRVEGVEFEAALFTNLSRDHLDYHTDMSAYGDAKLMLFRNGALRIAVINRDDPLAPALREAAATARIWTYGTTPAADIYPVSIDSSFNGLAVKLASPMGEISVATGLFGQVNVANIAAVVATLLALDFKAHRIVDALADVVSPAGRMESFGMSPRQARIFVDYAHTPAALEEVLKSLKAHTSGKLWCVFGCGGDRDRGKRAQMGAVADRWADEIILTNDNPRGERSGEIMSEIEKGITVHTARRQPDRAQAIRETIESASADDTVLIAGKGHEDQQQVGDRLYRFSDREVVNELLQGVAP